MQWLNRKSKTVVEASYHVGGDEGGQVEGGVVIEAKVILDQAISSVTRHLTLRHLMAWQLHAGESRAIACGCEDILLVRELHLRCLGATGAGSMDDGKMTHDFNV